MKKNMGVTDRVTRWLVAAVLIALAVTGIIPGVWGAVALAIGVVFILTSIIGRCPLYKLFGINTCERKPV